MAFANQDEIWKALHEGKSLTHLGFEGSVCLKDGELLHVVNGREEKTKFGFFAPELWSVGVPYNWAEHIPEQGVLCRVGGMIRLIKYRSTDGKYVDDCGFKMEDATPITKEEAAKYIHPEGILWEA